MKGLEICEKYYFEFGEKMLDTGFSDIKNKLSVGLVGSGSECFGFDDEISRDHDFEAGFCIFIPDESIIDRKTEFLLERAYAKLPKEFMGIKKGLLSPVGGSRHGVIRIIDFIMSKTGTYDGVLTPKQWLLTDENSLLEATNGKIFYDGSGEMTKIRKTLAYLPEEVRLKKLAGNLLIMAQAGQYNYLRCLAHGETGAAQLSVFEFVQAAINVIFLLNKAYVPYYKWAFKALKKLNKLSNLAETLEFLISSDNDIAETKAEIIEDIAKMVISELQEQKLTDAICLDLEKHAYSVNDKVSDPEMRNLHILYAIKK
ncbi:MAG: DUF4037 domain-containing protein [Clostridia bacterium]|nr:DUF4037 domain-containing protein [Clostridia bacterium]